jgi:hypothetical protein
MAKNLSLLKIKLNKTMNELILKYNLLDAFGKQEVMDFLEFLVQKKQKNIQVSVSDYKQKISQVSVWTEENISKIDAMKMAANDPLYLQDLQEVQADFEAIDHETL